MLRFVTFFDVLLLRIWGKLQILRLQILLHSRFWNATVLLKIMLILPVILPFLGMHFDGSETSDQILALLESS